MRTKICARGQKKAMGKTKVKYLIEEWPTSRYLIRVQGQEQRVTEDCDPLDRTKDFQD